MADVDGSQLGEYVYIKEGLTVIEYRRELNLDLEGRPGLVWVILDKSFKR